MAYVKAKILQDGLLLVFREKYRLRSFKAKILQDGLDLKAEKPNIAGQRIGS